MIGLPPLPLLTNPTVAAPADGTVLVTVGAGGTDAAAIETTGPYAP